MSRLDEIKARADAATPGPWSAKEGFTSDPMIEVYCQTVFINPDLDGDPIQPEAWADAEFIAASREDVPWLVSEVERLTAERDALAAQVAQVEALAEEWEREADDLLRNCYSGRDVFEAERTMQMVSELRAVLADTDADTTGTQPTEQEDQS